MESENSGRKSLWKKPNRGQFASVAANGLYELNRRQGDGQYFMTKETVRCGKKQPLVGVKSL